jgi:hypothetical protein
MSCLLFAPIALLPLPARGTALASPRHLALGTNSGALALALTAYSSVTGH